ncbi:MAG: AAA+ family ATPase [Pseudomonadota bacterium]
MKNSVLILLLSLPLSPALAQDAPADDGFSLMEEGAKLLFRGLMNEMEPALDGMGKAVTELEPALRDLLAMVDDIRNYQAPEMLDNGDILIRRKTPLDRPLGPRITPDAIPGPNGEIEL